MKENIPRKYKPKHYCLYCFEIAPNGDERNYWLDWHESWLHRTYWKWRNRING